VKHLVSRGTASAQTKTRYETDVQWSIETEVLQDCMQIEQRILGRGVIVKACTRGQVG